MIFLVVILVALLLWGITLFNRLIRDRQRVRAGWADIDVQLKRRHDLIPKLVTTVKGYAAYERATLETLTRLRAKSAALDQPAARGSAEGELGAGLRRLLALAEAYPELKADSSFLQLMEELSGTEERIQFARRYYNGCVRNLNTRIQTFPDLLLARLCGIGPAEYFELEDLRQAQTPEVSL